MKLFRVGLTASMLMTLAASLSAQLTHTGVSATGNDSTCTGATARRCASFAQAINLLAAGGTVSVLGCGDYGANTITQSITIDGTGGGTIGFAGDCEGIYINAAAAANIVLRNLSIDGGGTGSDAIFVASTASTAVVNVMIDGCLLSGFTQIGVGLGSESPMYMTIRNTSIQGGTLGVRTFQSTGAVVYDHVQLDHVDIQGATTSGVFTRNGNVDILNSTISGNTGTGGGN